MSKRTVSDEFDSLDATEKAATEAALNRCRALVRLESKLRNKMPGHFVAELALADLYASLERAALVLEQKSRDNAPAPAEKGSQARGRQRHR